MTIEVFGHVAALEQGPRGKIVVRIQIEMSRMVGEAGEAPFIEIIADPAEVDIYRPGMGIRLQIQPHSFEAKSEGKA